MFRNILYVLVLLGALFMAPGSAYAQDATSSSAAVPTPQTTEPAPADKAAAPVPDPAPNAGAAQYGTYDSARVLRVRLEPEGTEQNATQKQFYDIEFRTGPHKGERVTVSSDVESNPYQIEPKQGDTVVVLIQSDEQGMHYYIEGFDRRVPLALLIALFVLTLVVLAGWQGLKVSISIIASVLIIGGVLIPAFLRGANPVPIAIALSTVLIFLTTGMSVGWNRKAFVTAIGSLGGVLVAYGVSHLFSDWSHLSGLSTEDDRLFFSQNPHLNPRGLLFAGIIVAAMGVVEDVAVSIESGVEEVAKANRRLPFKDLFRAGMVVGKDHMSALANTLIFAYVGGSLSTLLLYSQYGGSWLKFLNFDAVTDEVIRSLAGTIGLVFTVPITALLAAWFALGAKLPRRTKSLVHRSGDHASE